MIAQRDEISSEIDFLRKNIFGGYNTAADAEEKAIMLLGEQEVMVIGKFQCVERNFRMSTLVGTFKEINFQGASSWYKTT